MGRGMEIIASGLIVGMGWFTLKMSGVVLMMVAKTLTGGRE